MKKLNTIDADTLQTIAYEPISILVDDLLLRGLNLIYKKNQEHNH